MNTKLSFSSYACLHCCLYSEHNNYAIDSCEYSTDTGWMNSRHAKKNKELSCKKIESSDAVRLKSSPGLIAAGLLALTRVRLISHAPNTWGHGCALLLIVLFVTALFFFRIIICNYFYGLSPHMVAHIASKIFMISVSFYLQCDSLPTSYTSRS